MFFKKKLKETKMLLVLCLAEKEVLSLYNNSLDIDSLRFTWGKRGKVEVIMNNRELSFDMSFSYILETYNVDLRKYNAIG